MEKVTVYFNSGLCSIGNVEGRLQSATKNEYQPEHGDVMVVPKGCRKARWYTTIYHPYILVVKGWGHPETPDAWQAAED